MSRLILFSGNRTIAYFSAQLGESCTGLQATTKSNDSHNVDHKRNGVWTILSTQTIVRVRASSSERPVMPLGGVLGSVEC